MSRVMIMISWNTFGAGKEESDTLWKAVVRQALFNELLVKDIEHPGVFKVSKKGKEFMEEPFKIMISRDHDYSTEASEEEESEKVVVVGKSYDTTLFDMLKALRKQVAKQKDLPPYVIFQDPSLEEMATL